VVGVEHLGYIVIADITGYTVYLNESELDHAKGTLTDLLELLIQETKPPLVINRLEGDAVFSYGLDESFVNAQTFLESIEDTYVAFRRAVELMVLNNTCKCSACANVANLDLKFFVHHGTFALQEVGQNEELMGTDVNLIHRLLKNSVTEETGIKAYILCTDAAETALGLAGMSETLVAHTERVPDFGEVQVWIRDMHPVYEARRQETATELSPDQILAEDHIEIAVPREILWDYVNQSKFRNFLLGSDRFEVENKKDGMIGSGSVYLCYHGKKQISQVVLDWQPFDRLLVETRPPMPGRPVAFPTEIRLESIAKGTRMDLFHGAPTGPRLKRALVRRMLKSAKQAKQSHHELEEFRHRVESDYAAHQSRLASPAELPHDLIGEAAAASLRDG
jgi:hypothetical protein